MQGYDDSNTIPHHVWLCLKQKDVHTTIHNAGFLSYSPAIFIPQAKQLIPNLKPAFVVIDIDETDLGDDFIRYGKLILKDEKGRTIGVRSTPLNYEHNYRLLQIRKEPIFIIKLFKTWYHKKI
ncbi:MAG: hypothetical protein SV375_22530, partial [Thermodesulfobacteriota bacterium]|nr:hypothetical protein [Thermodesulfobacteriota bacterium]